MSDFNSGALVFFGATGDLAYKKIFPALQAMVKRGHLNVPVIGVARGSWNLDAYKRILGDAMAGGPTLFGREDYVEEAWRIVDPVLNAGTPVRVCDKGTWGPAEVEQTVSPPEGWHNPAAADQPDFRVSAPTGSPKEKTHEARSR